MERFYVYLKIDQVGYHTLNAGILGGVELLLLGWICPCGPIRVRQQQP